MRFILATALLALTLITPAHARGYLGIDYFGGLVDDSMDEYNPGAVRLRSGAFYDRYLGLEGHYAIGVSEDEQGGTEFELDNLYGLYLLGQLPMADWFSVFARVGVAWTRGTFTSPTGSQDRFDESDFSFGAGASITLGERTDISADWMQYLDDDNVAQVQAINLGITFWY